MSLYTHLIHRLFAPQDDGLSVPLQAEPANTDTLGSPAVSQAAASTAATDDTPATEPFAQDSDMADPLPQTTPPDTVATYSHDVSKTINPVATAAIEASQSFVPHSNMDSVSPPTTPGENIITQADATLTQSPSSREIPLVHCRFQTLRVHPAAQHDHIAPPKGRLLKSAKNVQLLHNDFAACSDAAFESALLAYDDLFFEGQALVILTLMETSGAARHTPRSITLDGDTLTIDLERKLPAIQIMDMAQFQMLIELPVEPLEGIGAVHVHLHVPAAPIFLADDTFQETEGNQDS